MRLLYTLFIMFLWVILAENSQLLMGASVDTKFLALAIMIGGAMAGGD